MDITYEVYNDEQQIIDKINSLEPMFQRMSSENNTQVVCYEDLYFLYICSFLYLELNYY